MAYLHSLGYAHRDLKPVSSVSAKLKTFVASVRQYILFLPLGEHSIRQERKFETHRFWIMRETEEWNRIAFANIVRLSNVRRAGTHIGKKIFRYQTFFQDLIIPPYR